MGTLDKLLETVAPTLLAVLVTLIVRRQLAWHFPFFLTYAIAVILGTSAQIWASRNYLMYFKVYWGTEALFAVLALLALHEIFYKVFIAFYDLKWFWLLFPGTALAVSGLSIWMGLHYPPAHAPNGITLILSFAIGVSLVEAALLGVFILLVWLLSLSRDHYAFGIAEGFAISALGTWLSFGALYDFGTKFRPVAKYGPPVAYFIAVVLWLDTFSRSHRPEVWEEWQGAISPGKLLKDITEYNRILRRFLGRNGGP